MQGKHRGLPIRLCGKLKKKGLSDFMLWPMKKILPAVLFFIIVNVAGFLMLTPSSPLNLKKQVIYIAVAGPMSGAYAANGEEMRRGIGLYLDRISREGKFRDKKTELLIYDDRDRQTAIKIAAQIADENKVLLVIGHYGSTESAAAGTIYKKTGIPAITASATAESVTLENDWYFRTVPDNRFMGTFIANYMKKALDRTTVSMIWDDSEYGATLARNFKSEAVKLGFGIKNEWKIDTESRETKRQLKNIVGWLRSADDPGMIFFGAGAATGVDFSGALRYPGTDFPLIGADSFSTPSFISRFNDLPREQASPGYYSEGIYAVAPFIPDMAGKRADAFREEFYKKYGAEPSWIAACYYDAAKVALEAVERAEIQGRDLREDRRKVRDALTRFDGPGVAVSGVVSDIYFDKDRNAAAPLVAGIWRKQTFLPAFRQYLYAADAGAPASEDETLKIGKQVFLKTQAVYAGIDINKIYNLNIAEGTYTADFFLRFRFQGSFDDSRIEFTNAVHPLRLDSPFKEEFIAEANATVRSYRVTADFRNDFDAALYPFDRQSVKICFRHADLPVAKLIYVPDLASFPSAAYPQKADAGEASAQDTEREAAYPLTAPVAGWRVADAFLYQSSIEIPDSGAAAASYSRMVGGFHILRNSTESLFLKNFFPMIVIFILLYATYLVLPEKLTVSMLICAASLAIATGVHYAIRGTGFRMMTYTVYAGYISAGLSVLISVAVDRMHRHNAAGKVRLLICGGKVLHILLVCAVAVTVAWLYWHTQK
ncbi:MAG: hypothetical protein BWK80_26120 [Desulfobacteraceae bacterium IS3]|nr:MAG: hypothetical protein BWK80_26120 [Desulfobacteraceae bacterium IS3]